MNFRFIIFLISFIFLGCSSSYIPFENMADKKEAMRFAVKSLSIEKSELEYIKKNDSILFSLDKSLKANVSHDLIERRLDSFYLKKYTSSELLFILDMDRKWKGDIPMEFIRNQDLSKFPSYDSLEEAQKALDSISNQIIPAYRETSIDTIK